MCLLALRRDDDDEDAEVGALLVAELLAIARAWAESMKKAASRPAPAVSRIRR